MIITVKKSEESPPEEIEVRGVLPPPGEPACHGCGFSHGGSTTELLCTREALRIARAQVAQLKSIVSRRKSE